MHLFRLDCLADGDLDFDVDVAVYAVTAPNCGSYFVVSKHNSQCYFLSREYVSSLV